MQKMNCHRNLQNFWDGILVCMALDEKLVMAAIHVKKLKRFKYCDMQTLSA